jgi:putative FmdB family regulatory protein
MMSGSIVDQSPILRNPHPQSARHALELSMPLFEYECRGCGHRFEHLTRADHAPACPSCRGVELQKLMSVFAAQSSTPAKSFSDRPMSACGSCGDPRGPGACSMN